MENQPITTLAQFYALMSNTRKTRRNIVYQYLETSEVDSSNIEFLQASLESLNAINQTEEGKQLSLGKEGNTIPIDISYEENELQKDILFLTKGEDAFNDHLRSIHPTFAEQIEETTQTLKGRTFKNFITDRDGTVNNYCGRYLSSVQSVYNALFLTRFVRKCVENAVMLTSAPLENGGMVDVCTMPNKTFILAGSKGREYRDKKWRRNTYPIETLQQKQLDIINEQIAELIKKSPFKKFSYIGSGFQRKFGQSTIARQDISGSIDEKESNDFLQIITNLIFDIDREKKTFRIEDTGLDIEIILTIADPASSESLKDFDKADGVAFLNDRLHLELDKGPNLVSGDTASDIPMLSLSLEKTSDTTGIFVTKDKKMQKKVREVCPGVIFLDEPDILVAVLNELAK
jgi:hypothetical protein